MRGWWVRYDVPRESTLNLYAYGILGLALMAAVSWGAIERGNAIQAKSDLASLKASYALTAQKAKDDAAKQEAADKAAIQIHTAQAIQQAQTQANNAQSQLRAYQAKLAAAATEKDLGHRCAGVEIPKDLLP